MNLLQPDMSIGLNNSYYWFFHPGGSRDDRSCLEKSPPGRVITFLAALFDKFDVPVIGQALLEGIYTISSPRDIT